MYEYKYTKSNIVTNKLQNEIESSGDINTGLSYLIWHQPDDLRVMFEDEITEGEQTALDNIVDSHNGDPYPGYVDNDPESLILSSVNMSSTTSTSWQTKAYKISNPTSSGTYKISWSYFWKTYAAYSNYNPEIDVRVMLVPVGSEVSDNQAVARQHQKSVYLDGQAIPSYGFAFRALDKGAYIVGLQYRRVGSVGTVYIADVFIEMVKISNKFLVPENLTSGCNQLIIKQAIEPVEREELVPIQL
jgi:hypothetical protein